MLSSDTGSKVTGAGRRSRCSIKTPRMRKLEQEQGRLIEHLEETQALIRNLKRDTREAQVKLRKLNGQIAVESFKQPVLRLVHDRDAVGTN